MTYDQHEAHEAAKNRVVIELQMEMGSRVEELGIELERELELKLGDVSGAGAHSGS